MDARARQGSSDTEEDDGGHLPDVVRGGARREVGHTSLCDESVPDELKAPPEGDVLPTY